MLLQVAARQSNVSAVHTSDSGSEHKAATADAPTQLTWQAVVGGGTAYVGIVRVLGLIGEHEISGGTQAGEVERVRRRLVGHRVLILALISWVTVRVRTRCSSSQHPHNCDANNDGLHRARLVPCARSTAFLGQIRTTSCQQPAQLVCSDANFALPSTKLMI